MRICRESKRNERSTNYLKIRRQSVNTLRGSSSNPPFNENKWMENCAGKRVVARKNAGITSVLFVNVIFDRTDERRNEKV